MDLFGIAAKPELTDMFFRAGRDLLDPYSGEYNSISFKERFNNLIKIYSSEVSITLLVRAYQKFWLCNGRADIADSVTDALCDVIEYVIECKLQDRSKRRESSKLRYAEHKAEKEIKAKIHKPRRMLRAE